MELSLVLTILNLLVVPFATAAGYMLWNKITGIEKEHEAMATRIWTELKTVERDIQTIKGNYLDRFDEIKTLLYGYHLQSIEKISILETLLKQHTKTGE